MKEKFTVRFMADVWPFRQSAFASNLASSSSSSSSSSSLLLVNHEMYLEVNAMGGMYSHKHAQMPRALHFDHEEKTGDSGGSVVQAGYLHTTFFRLTTLRSSQ